MIHPQAAASSTAAPNLRRIATFSRTRAHLRAFWRSAYRAAPLWWVAAVAAFVVYGWVRGVMDEVGFPVYGAGLETRIFGGLPSVWLQEQLYERFPSVIGWGVVVIHGSWFAIPWAAALYVTVTSPKRLGSLFIAIFALFVIVQPVFALAPMEPPWMASAEVTRVTAVTLSRDAADIGDLNQVAAMPSLHVALPLLVGLWFWREGIKKGGYVMFAYAALVAFEVVLGGEHYIIDAIGAAAVAFAALGVVMFIERRRTASSASHVRVRAVARRESGQNLLEFALLMPFVLLFIGAIVVFGLAIQARSSVQQAVREGARQAAVGNANYASIAAGNASEQLAAADIRICHPVGTSGTRGKVGDPVQVFIYKGGAKGYPHTIAPASGILNVVGLRNLSVRMSPVATARLEKSVASPDTNCNS